MTRSWPVLFKRKWFWVCVVVLVPLYAITWVGGWISYARQLQERVDRGYRTAQRENEEEEAEGRLRGFKVHPIELRKGGPTSHVYWCLPLLPGVLLANSDESIGPLYSEGGMYIVLYYGFGCTRVCMLCGWLA